MIQPQPTTMLLLLTGPQHQPARRPTGPGPLALALSWWRRSGGTVASVPGPVLVGGAVTSDLASPEPLPLEANDPIQVARLERRRPGRSRRTGGLRGVRAGRARREVSAANRRQDCEG